MCKSLQASIARLILKGIFSSTKEIKYETTIQTSYPPPESDNSCISPECTGLRRRIVENGLYEMVNSEVGTPQTSGLLPVDYVSTTCADYAKGMVNNYFHFTWNDLCFIAESRKQDDDKV